MTELKARFEAGASKPNASSRREKPRRWRRSTRKIQAMVGRIAQWRKMTYIVKVSNQPISGENPNSVMAAMANTMVYADPRNDITNDVVYNLNKIYKSTGGATVKGRPLRTARGGMLRLPERPVPKVATELAETAVRRWPPPSPLYARDPQPLPGPTNAASPSTIRRGGRQELQATFRSSRSSR